MKNNHFLHGVVTVSLFALNIVIITVFLLNNTWNSYLRGEMSLQVALLVSPVLFITLMVLAIEWKGIVNSLKVEEESLASVEKKHPYLPKVPQRILTGILSMIAMVVIVPVITRAAASSGEILHMLSSGTGSIFETQEISSDSSVSSSLDETDSSSSESQDHGAAEEIVNAQTGAVLTGSGGLETGSGSLSSSTGSGAEVMSSSAQSEASGEVHAPVSSSSFSSSVSSVSDVALSPAVLTLESRDGKLAYEASDSPSFTLVETSIAHNDPSVGADGTLKDQKALEEIVRSVVNAEDIQDAMSKAIIDHARGEIAKQVTEDTVSVNTLKQISESSDTGAPRLDAMQAQVQANIDVNDSIKTEVSQTVSRDEAVQTALDVLSTEEVKQSIVENIVSDIIDTLATGGSAVAIVDDATVFRAAVEVNAAAVDAAEKSVLTSVESNSDIKQYIAQAVVSSTEMSEDSSLVWTDTQEAPQVDSNPIITVRLTGKNGKVLYPNYHFKRGSVVLVLEPEQSFTPGVYLLEVEITNPLTGEVTTQTEEFAWGVLAMNPDKDTYSPSETAHIAIGVLDDDGEMVCDADVTLTVQKPDGSSIQMQTSDGSIRMNSSACSTKNSMQVTPDFETDLLLSQAGTYSLTLEAQTPNGTHSITSSILVSGNLAYSIRRTAATRLYPFGWSPMTIVVRFNEQFSGTLTDILPEEFAIRSDDSSAVITKQEGTGSLISWTGLWAAGETATFAYQYDAPDISPQFYLVGPLSLRGNATETQESRSWQIANDAINVSITGTAYSNEGITPLASKTVAVSLNGAAAAGTAVTDAGGQYTITGLTLTGGTVVAVYIENETEDAVTVSTGSGGAMTGMTLYQDQLIVKSGTGGNATVSTALMAVADNNADADISALYSISSNNTTVVAGKKLSIWTGATLSLAGTLTANRVHLQGSLRPNNFALTFSNHYTQSGGTLFGSSGTRTIGNITIDSGTFISTSGTMTVSGSYIRAGGTFTHNSGTVSFTSPRTASIDVPTTETFSGFHVNTGVNAINIQIGTGDTITVVGTAQLQNGKLKTGTLNVQAAFTNNSTWDGGVYFVNFSGSANQTWLVGGSTSDAFVTINKSSGKLTMPTGNNYTTNTGITLLSGSFSIQNTSFTMGGGLTVAAGATMVSTGSIAFTPTNSNTATLNFAGSGYILNAALGGTTSGRIAIQTGSTLPIRGRLTLSNNAIINGGGVIDVKGNILESGTSLAGNAPVRLSGTGTQFIIRQGSSVFHGGSLIIAKPSGQVTLSGALTLNTANQNLLLTGGTLNLNGHNLTVNNIFTVGTGTTLKLKGTETITGGPDFIHRGATTYYTEPSQTLRLKNFTPNYQNIVLGSTGSAIFRPSKQGMTMSGTLTISGGTLQFDGGQSLTISGSWLRTGGAFTAGTGTIIFANQTPSTISETSAFNNLTINGFITLANTLDVNGNLVVQLSGTLDASSSNYAIALAGNFDNQGSFVKRSGTVTLDGGNQTLSGSTIWHNLTKTISSASTLFLDYSSRQSASGALTLRGIAANLLSIRSTRAASVASILLDGDSGTQTIDYLDIQDSSASNGASLVCYTATEGCVNSGNNTNWLFSAALPTGTGTVKGLVFNDLNGNGVKNVSETTGLQAIGIQLTGTTATGGAISTSTTTNSLGQYFFSGSIISNTSGYTITVNSGTTPTGYLRTSFNSSGSNVLGTGAIIRINFGYVQPSTGTGKVYIDTNDNGRLDTGETTGISNTTVTVLGTTATGGTLNRSTTTSSTGGYLFSGLAPSLGQYTFGVTTNTIPSGYRATNFTNSGVTIPQGNSAVTANFGYFWYGTMTGSIFIDTNANGVKDSGENATYNSGATISVSGLTASGGSLSVTRQTTSTGSFTLQDVPTSNTTYAVTLSVPSGYQVTTASSFNRSIAVGQNASMSLFGLKPLSSTGTIKGVVFNDENGNGQKNVTESVGLSAVTVTLNGQTETGATLSRSTSTNALGQYFFSGALLSNASGYTVAVTTNTLPAGYLRTRFNSSGSNILTANGLINVEFGYVQASTLSGTVYVDANENAVQDVGETTIFSGATLSLTGISGTGGTVDQSTVSSGTGFYIFSNLPTSSGSFILVITPPTGYTTTSSNSRIVTFGTGGQLKIQRFGYILTPVTSSSSSSTSSSSDAGVSSSTVTLPTGGSRIRYTPIVIQPEIDEGAGGSSSVSSSSSSVRSSSSSSVSSSSASSVPWNRLPVSRQPILPTASVTQDTTEFIFNQQTEAVVDTLDNRWNDIQKQVEDTVQTVRQSVSAGVQTTQQTAQAAIGMTASTLRTAVTSIAAGANAIGTRIASFGVRAQNNVASAGNRLGFSLADVTTRAAVATANSLAISYKTMALAVYSTRTTGSLMFSGLNVALVDNNENIRAAAEVIAANIREGDRQIRQVAMAISAVGNTALQGVADTVGAGGNALQDTAGSIASTFRMSTKFVAGSLSAAADTIAMTVGTSVDRIGMSLDTAVTSTNRVVAFAFVSSSRFASETVSGIGSLSDQAKTLLIKKDLATEALDRPLPPRKYQTTIAKKNDKVVIGELSFNILKSFGVPYRQTPVILFSTPKIAITDDAGDVTFHDVEVGTYHIEIHIDDKTVETREVVVEPPSKINLTEDSAVHVKLPLIEIQVETPAQTAMHSAAPAGMPWYWLVVIPLLMTNAVMGFLLIVHRQRRKEVVQMH